MVYDFGSRHIVTLADGDRINTYYTAGVRNSMVILFHGLAGSIQSDYIRRTFLLAKKMGLHSVVVNHRGADDPEGLARNPYHSGRGEDASDVISYYRRLFPELQIIAIGFSLSGSIVLNLVSEQRGSCLPDRAISVNAPLDLENCSKRLSSGFNRLYDSRFVLRLSKDLQKGFATGRLEKDYRVSRFSTLRDFDEIFTAPASGFRSREHYYQSCSVKPHLPKIKVPTLMLTAADDPFIDVKDYQEASCSDQVQVHIEPVGGHVGYLSAGTPLRPQRWLDSFLEAHLVNWTGLK